VLLFDGEDDPLDRRSASSPLANATGDGENFVGLTPSRWSNGHDQRSDEGDWGHVTSNQH
jgi:hypothetical protein